MKGNRVVNRYCIETFRIHLIEMEKSEATIEKYMRDVIKFYRYADEQEISKDTVLGFKKNLMEKDYAHSSINSMLAAVNCFLTFLGWSDLKVRYLKVQRQIFRPEESELTRKEYERLCAAAERKNDNRLSLILQTICSTGIRVSELRYITAESVRDGKATVSLKGKTRVIFLSRKLQKKLTAYMRKAGIESGSLFINSKGKPMDRTSIWRAMKGLCRSAGVNAAKVYPHNLRHLFARIFYAMEKDIVKLADMLGHSSIDTTRIYIMSTGTEHRKRLETMKLVI